jgi:endogenous inhibitor of DNA gyrase (YacG/DUF329 family)
MPMQKGTRLTDGQQWSDKWIGYIDCGGGVYRQPFRWGERTCNRYAIEKECAFCKKLVLQDKANSRKHRNAFCSAECKKQFIAAQTRGNKIIKKRSHGRGSHVLVRQPEHHRAVRGVVYEHILVAEKLLGRPILKTERVHHINCIKDDNRAENLFVCENDREHFLIHGSLNDCVAELIELGLLAFDRTTKQYKVVSQ